MKRPLSAQHNKTSFGEFYMTKKLNIVPKISNYRIDGSGRDSYINFNNGGNIKPSYDNIWNKYCNKRSKIDNYNKSYNVISKVSVYKSDGQGRDQYIVRDCGGFYRGGFNNDFNPGHLNCYAPYLFSSTLRSYNTRPTKIPYNDFSQLSKNHVIEQNKKKQNEIAKRQRVVSARLSAPKKVNQKYAQIY